MSSDPDDHRDQSTVDSNVSEVEEHGMRWLICICGAAWAVVDTNCGEQYEQVSDGDPSFHDDEWED